MEYSKYQWNYCKLALEKLEESISCALCSNFIACPQQNGSCEHTFCRSCLSSYDTSSVCPKCQLQYNSCDVYTNRQLSIVVEQCNRLRELFRAERQPQHDRVDIAMEVSTIEGYPEQKSNATDCVSDINNNPASMLSTHVKTAMPILPAPTLSTSETTVSEMLTPVSQRTRKAVVKRLRRHRVAVANTSWDIGGDLPSKCLSCQKSSDQKVTFDSSDKRNAKGETSLHTAVIKGDIHQVKALLNCGAEVNVRDNAGWTPLHEACNHGYVELAKLLLERGAILNTPGGTDNDTPLHDAVINGRVKCVKLLISWGASLQSRNASGLTVYEMATSQLMKRALNTPVDSRLYSKTVESPRRISQSKHTVMMLTSGLASEQRDIVDECAKLLNAQVLASFSHQVSHVVTSANETGVCRRTMKYMLALLSHTWIVKFNWVVACLEEKTRVDEEKYEVTNEAASISRSHREQGLPPLFSGCQFYLRGEFCAPNPTRDELAQLIRAGGGSLLSRPPRSLSHPATLQPYHAHDGCPAAVIVLEERLSAVEMTGHIAHVSTSWLLDSITSYRLLDFIPSS